MKLSTAYLRGVSIRSETLFENYKENPSDGKEKSSENLAQALESLRKKFGPLAPNVVIFPGVKNSFVGFATMRFDVPEASVPCAGIVEYNPIIPSEVNMADGALLGELARMGIFLDKSLIQWRVTFSLEGN